MELKSTFDWNTLGELAEKRKSDTLAQAEAYWNETAPYGGERFTPERGMALLLFDARRFAAGLSRLVQKADEQKALMDHRAASGQEVADADRQRWFAYLDVAHIAAAALSRGGPAAPLENSEGGR